MFRRIVLVVVTLVTLTPALVFGQSSASALSGAVKDSSGATIPGATIRIVNAATSASVVVVSDGQGAYQSDPLTPGTYRVEVTLDGFEAATRQIVIDLGKAAVADFTLTPARLSEAIVVTARRIEETVPIPGYRAKNGANMMDARRVTLADGRIVSGASAGDGGPQ